MTSPTRWTWVWTNSRRWRRTGKPGTLVAKSQTWLSDWTTTTNQLFKLSTKFYISIITFLILQVLCVFFSNLPGHFCSLIIFFYFIVVAAAAAAAKSLQSCPTLCNSIYSSRPGSPIPGILQARTLEWVAISFFNKVWYMQTKENWSALKRSDQAIKKKNRGTVNVYD